MKIALISFDGLDPRIIYKNRDELENIDSLLDNSMHGSWRTPGHTIPSYISTLTGRTYNESNFYWDVDEGGFGRHRQTEYDFIWDICDSSITLLNMPVLYPPEDIDDCMVCGFLAPDSINKINLAKPDEVQDILTEINYREPIDIGRMYDDLGPEGMINELKSVMDNRAEAAERLINKYDSDLFYGVWTSPDRWFHKAAVHNHDYLPLYKKADDILGKLLKIISDDIPLIVFSDHGFAHFRSDNDVNKGHMYDGWYAIRNKNLPTYRDNSLNIQDLFPTVLNYLECDVPDYSNGRILFHSDEQDEEIVDRLKGIGYLDD